MNHVVFDSPQGVHRDLEFDFRLFAESLDQAAQVHDNDWPALISKLFNHCVPATQAALHAFFSGTSARFKVPILVAREDQGQLRFCPAHEKPTILFDGVKRRAFQAAAGRRGGSRAGSNLRVRNNRYWLPGAGVHGLRRHDGLSGRNLIASERVRKDPLIPVIAW